MESELAFLPQLSNLFFHPLHCCRNYLSKWNPIWLCPCPAFIFYVSFDCQSSPWHLCIVGEAFTDLRENSLAISIASWHTQGCFPLSSLYCHQHYNASFNFFFTLSLNLHLFYLFKKNLPYTMCSPKHFRNTNSLSLKQRKTNFPETKLK